MPKAAKPAKVREKLGKAKFFASGFADADMDAIAEGGWCSLMKVGAGEELCGPSERESFVLFLTSGKVSGADKPKPPFVSADGLAAKPKRKQVVAAVTKVGLVKCSRVGFLDMYAHFAASGNAGAVARLDDVLRTGGVKKLKKLVKKGEEEKYEAILGLALGTAGAPPAEGGADGGGGAEDSAATTASGAAAPPTTTTTAFVAPDASRTTSRTGAPGHWTSAIDVLDATDADLTSTTLLTARREHSGIEGTVRDLVDLNSYLASKFSSHFEADLPLPTPPSPWGPLSPKAELVPSASTQMLRVGEGSNYIPAAPRSSPGGIAQPSFASVGGPGSPSGAYDWESKMQSTPTSADRGSSSLYRSDDEALLGVPQFTASNGGGSQADAMMAKMSAMEAQLASQMQSFREREDAMRREFENRERALEQRFAGVQLGAGGAGESGSSGGAAPEASTFHINRHGSIDIRSSGGASGMGGTLAGAAAVPLSTAEPAPAATPMPATVSPPQQQEMAPATPAAAAAASMPTLATSTPEERATGPSSIDYGDEYVDTSPAALTQEEYEQRCDELLSSVENPDEAVDAFISALKAKADEAAELAAEAEAGYGEIADGTVGSSPSALMEDAEWRRHTAATAKEDYDTILALQQTLPSLLARAQQAEEQMKFKKVEMAQMNVVPDDMSRAVENKRVLAAKAREAYDATKKALLIAAASY